MIIRSQDKKMIINFNGASNIYMQGTEIWANTYHGIAKLGTYSAEEKALKVLDMIQQKFLQYGTIERGFSVEAVVVTPRCFKMPQDSEV